MARPPSEAPVVPVLLLGDAGCGKSTFLSRLMLGSHGISTPRTSLPVLRDLDQPFSLDISLYNRPYRFEFYDTASPTNYTLLKPEVILLCYSIGEPESLKSVSTHWRRLIESHFNYNEQLPVILLGLMRDLRQKEDYDGTRKLAGSGGSEEANPLNGRRKVHPHEGLNVAQRMRLDRYCECSALTGELCREVFEDLARTMALTTTDKGGRTPAEYCNIM